MLIRWVIPRYGMLSAVTYAVLFAAVSAYAQRKCRSPDEAGRLRAILLAAAAVFTLGWELGAAPPSVPALLGLASLIIFPVLLWILGFFSAEGRHSRGFRCVSLVTRGSGVRVVMNTERIEILPTTLLDSHPDLAAKFRGTAARLGLELGWHYLLDVIWAVQQLGAVTGLRIMDAGAGFGVMQWWLAARGENVISVDRMSRAQLGRHFRAWCRVDGLRPQDLVSLRRAGLVRMAAGLAAASWPERVRALAAGVRDALAGDPWRHGYGGRVTMYNQDLRAMKEIADNSVDAVVSISALEHNPPDELQAVVAELLRVLKPGGRLVATLAAGRDADWYHKPSRGWCYTEPTLRQVFRLAPSCPSNFERFDELFLALKECRDLQRTLARFYFQSGENGMPWGVWDPRYQPVGVVKVKPV